MKKILSILSFLVLMTTASEIPVASSSRDLAFGIGAKKIGFGGSLSNSWYGAIGPTLFFDYGVHDMVSVGGDVNFRFKNDKVSTGTWDSWNRRWALTPSARVAFHPFGLPALKGNVEIADKLDTYVGSRIGANIYHNWAYNTNNGTLVEGSEWSDTQTYVYFSFLIGANYYVSDNFGFFIEGDWEPDASDVDVVRFDFGVAFKF